MPAAASPLTMDRPSEPANDARIDRISTAGVSETLERIRASSLLAEGAVNMIGLDAIRTKLGDRWPAKRARVWEHVERELERRLTPADIRVRVDDVNYLVATASAPGFAAQGICLTILQDVLKYFLGELRVADVLVRGVSALADNEIVSAPIDLAKVGRALAAESQSFAPPEAAAVPREASGATGGGPLVENTAPVRAWKPPLPGRSAIIPLAPPKRPPFDLKLSVEPVWSLKRGLIGSFLIERAGAPVNAEAADLEEMDVATCAYAVGLLQEQKSQGGPLLLHVPISFTSLATQRSRERLLRLTEPVREPMRGAVLLEICGLNGGVPPSRLIEVVGLLRSLFAGILGRVQPSRSALASSRGCGLRGLVLDAALLGAGEGFTPRLDAFADAARDIAPNMIVHGLPSNLMVDKAAAAGFSHASVAREAAS